MSFLYFMCVLYQKLPFLLLFGVVAPNSLRQILQLTRLLHMCSGLLSKTVYIALPWTYHSPVDLLHMLSCIHKVVASVLWTCVMLGHTSMVLRHQSLHVPLCLSLHSGWCVCQPGRSEVKETRAPLALCPNLLRWALNTLHAGAYFWRGLS